MPTVYWSKPQEDCGGVFVSLFLLNTFSDNTIQINYLDVYLQANMARGMKADGPGQKKLVEHKDDEAS